VTGGSVRMKIGEVGAGWEKTAPEYVDCQKIAVRTGRPLKDIMDEARVVYARSVPRKRKIHS